MLNCNSMVTVGAAVLAGLAITAQAQTRDVVVNGQHLHALQLSRIEALYCSPIANGRYWYDANSGLWGYEGDPTPRGRFVNRCGQRAGRKSLSQRGLLYSTQEIMRGAP